MKKSQLKKLLPLLTLLSKSKPEAVKDLLTHLNENACEGIYECVCNLLHNENIPFKKRSLVGKKLLNYKSQLRIIGNQSSRARKNKSLKQVGGSLSLILATVLPLLVTYLYNQSRK